MVNYFNVEENQRTGTDPFAVAVFKDRIIVGHLPRKFAAVFSLFLRRGGTILCRVNGSRRYSVDLPQGGLEVPCILVFSGEQSLIKKLQHLTAVLTATETDNTVVKANSDAKADSMIQEKAKM